jgi:enoyl-CoA hydratase/carnithine racemase
VYQAVCFAKKVVVTEVRGACLGAGSALMLCSDLTVAGEGASFGSPFATVPESNFVLAALTMRLNRAKAWLIRDSHMSAAEALDAGLVNAVAPDPAAHARAMAAAVSRMPIDGITMSKMLQQAVLDGHGVGRDFDQAGFYAAAMWGGQRDD